MGLIASAGTGTAASAQLQGLLDEHWRGLYDLLVTAPGSDAGLEGLIAPSAMSAAETRMTLDDLAAVAGIEGVEVAAPIGTVTVDAESGGVRLYVSAPITRGDTVEAGRGYRLTLTYTVDDGLGPRIVAQEQVGIGFDDADLPISTPMTPEQLAAEQGSVCYEDGVAYTEPSPDAPGCFVNMRFPMEVVHRDGQGEASATVVDGQVIALVTAVPQVPTTVALVDPAAEQALLGEAGAFLQPLVDLGGAEQTVQSLADHFASAPNARTPSIAAQAQQYADLLADVTGPDGELLPGFAGNAGQLVSPVLPVLAAPVQQGTLQLRARVESGFDPAEGAWLRELPPELWSDAPGTLVRETEMDASTLLDPFGTEALVLPLLTETAPVVENDALEAYAGLNPAGTAVSTALPYETRGDGVAVSAQQYLQPRLQWDGRVESLFTPLATGTAPGAQAMYRQLVEERLVEPQSPERLPTLVPVADYDASAIAIDDSSLGYAPLGSFDQVETTLVADASGQQVQPVTLAPPVTGFGITDPVPTVVTDIAQAGLLDLEAPISSIRVRVAGVEGGYTPQNIERVTEVGQRLVEAGYTVTMAAGSSRQAVPIELGGWAFGVTEADAVQAVDTLGTVEQQWPSIGAAQRVEAAVTTSTIGVLAIAIGAATLLFGVVQLAGVGPRRRDAALLARLGWRRSRIARRFAAEDAVVLGVLAVAGLGAIALMATQTIGTVDAATPWIVGAALAAAVLVAGAALAASVPPLRVTPAPQRALAGGTRAPAAAPRAIATSVVGFGIGQARLHVGHALTVLIALVLIGLAAAGAWTVVQQGIAQAGQTELADASSAQALVVQGLLAVIGIVSGVVLVVLARRLDARLRVGQWRALHAVGWGSRRIWSARAVELLTVGVPAIALAALIGWFAAPLTGVDDAAPIASIAGIAAAVALALLLALQRTDRTTPGTARSRTVGTEATASTKGRP